MHPLYDRCVEGLLILSASSDGTVRIPNRKANDIIIIIKERGMSAGSRSRARVLGMFLE